jgi:hypothetical protein
MFPPRLPPHVLFFSLALVFVPPRSFLTVKTYRLGSFAEVKFEELPRPAPFKASIDWAAPVTPDETDADGKPVSPTWGKRRRAASGSASASKSGRRSIRFTVEARRSRASVSVDSGLVLAFAVFSLAFLVGQVSAYMPAGFAPAVNRAVHPSSSRAAPATTTTSPAMTDPATVAAARKLKRATWYLPDGTGEARQLDEAVRFAVEAHTGQKRKSGEAYVVHPIETACILAEMRVDADAVVAGLLHDVVEDTDWTTEQLCARFGESVSSIVDGVTDVDVTGLSKVNNSKKNSPPLDRRSPFSPSFSSLALSLSRRPSRTRSTSSGCCWPWAAT